MIHCRLYRDLASGWINRVVAWLQRWSSKSNLSGHSGKKSLSWSLPYWMEIYNTDTWWICPNKEQSLDSEDRIRWIREVRHVKALIRPSHWTKFGRIQVCVIGCRKRTFELTLTTTSRPGKKGLVFEDSHGGGRGREHPWPKPMDVMSVWKPVLSLRHITHIFSHDQAPVDILVFRGLW